MIRTLLFSTLFPNVVRPNHGIFVETRLRELLKSRAVQAHVIAPVPWFPFRQEVFGEYAAFAQVPAAEERIGIPVEHPRYLLPPKVAMNVAPYTLAYAGLAAARRMIAAGRDFDLIDAHYVYPDGVAATFIGKALDRPVVITARGSDVNLLPGYRRPRALIAAALRDCAHVVAVSLALKREMVSLGADPDRITVLRNGVDLERFRPLDRNEARHDLGVSGFVMVSVGNLIPDKGHHLVIGALERIPGACAVIAGRGPEEAHLKAMARQLGVAHRVRFLGPVPQQRLAHVYSLADCLVLASEREGWPNVLLEAMACGTPVVASNVGGIPEVVRDGSVGVLMDEVSVDAVVRAVTRMRALAPERERVRSYAEGFSWDATTAGQIAVFERALRGSRVEVACA
jgi:glycosyltransferase involved in cell wall biosynthesis